MDLSFFADNLSILLFFGTIAVVIAGFPVAFALAGTALLFAWLGAALGSYDLRDFDFLPLRLYGIMTNEVLVAILLFVFMGVTLEKSQVAEQMLRAIGLALRRVRGGLGFGVLVVGALLAASTGIVGATVVAMGLLSLPIMLKAGYDKRLATGIICASGTLGQILPPSILLIILGDSLANAYVKAQQKAGNFGYEPVSILDLFAGAVVPGLLLVLLYALYVAFVAWRRPEACPPLQAEEGERVTFWALAGSMAPAIVLIVLVLGSILGGIATATEAAGVGASGALILAALYRRLSWAVFREILLASLKMTAMIFMIFVGASVFSIVFRGLGGEHVVHEILNGMPGGETGAIIFVLAVIFVLGFVLEYAEIVLIIIPTVGPILLQGDIDPVWFGIMVAVCLQTSFLTPPFGFALFYLGGVVPRSVTTLHIYRGIIPFVGLQLIALAAIFLLPELTTWLPDRLF